MDKKLPNINLFFIFLLVINIIFGILFSYLNLIINGDGITYAFKHLDIPLYLENNKEINSILENKKLPIEIFNYVDKEEYEKQVDLFFENKEISLENIKDLLDNSVKEYDKVHLLDVHANIQEDIEEIAKIIYTNINDKNIINKLNTYSLLGRVGIIFNIISIIISLVFIIKYKNLLYTGLSYTLITIGVYLSLKNEIISITNIFDKNAVTYLNNRLANICSIYFIIGIIILVIYLIMNVRKIYRKMKNNYIDYEWRYK